MLKLVSNTATKKLNLDEQVKSYKLLKNQIAALEKQCEALKSEMIEMYFYCNETYESECGLFKATYKSNEQEFFKTKDFKEANPEVYKCFVETKDIYRFLVK